MSLVKYFKENKILDTDIGQFQFVSALDQGGNAHVLKFSRDTHEFAVKFILHDDRKKLQRFRDEFFGAAQIPTHKNVVNCYHFDCKTIDNADYSLIVMKFYHSNLNKIGRTPQKSEEEKLETGWKLFRDLCKGLRHLHEHHIIHRDIKPQNIFYDANSDSFVVGDLGIAHFKDDIFAKEAHTEKDERLANYLFSAPEQADSRNKITAAADIYALGQVMQWYFTGKTNRGLGRKRFASDSQLDNVSIIDAVVSRALRSEPSERFQSIEDIRAFITELKRPKRGSWEKIHEFDDVIRQCFPEIRKKLAIVDEKRIEEFLAKFANDCRLDEFWYVLADGGDNTLKGIKHLDECKWLFNDEIEMTVKKLLVYRDDSHPYKNFFILLFGPDKRFEFSNRDGEVIKRKSTKGWEQDMAVLVDDRFYISPNDTTNGYYRETSGTVTVTPERFRDRYRYLVPYGVLVVPTETASAGMLDREPSSNLIHSAILERTLTDEALKIYLTATQPYHSPELTKFN